MIYLAADIHGHMRLGRLKEELARLTLINSDYLIILGDAGIVWSTTEHSDVKSYYDSLPCKTLFLDGNHENFDLLYQYPQEFFCGGRIHRVSDKIIHLMRGEIYLLDGESFFVFGGGFSTKKLTNSSPVFIWEQEMPSKAEYENGIQNLKNVDFSVDYVLTHVAPTAVAENMGAKLCSEEKVLNDYLQEISGKIGYKKWYFGHYHKDAELKSCLCVYDRVVKLGECDGAEIR